MSLSKSNFVQRQMIYSLEGEVEVYKAFSNYHQRLVCLKILPIREDRDINAVLQEALVQASLDHKNVCKIYDCFVESSGETKEAVVVMELMEEDLLTAIQSRRAKKTPWTEAELMKTFLTLIQAFAFIQSKGIAHRDIKPNNILIGPKGELKICDFGVSKRVIDMERFSSVRGTQVYMSPACKMSVRVNSSKVMHDPYRSDVYSLGLTFLSMARLVPPLELLVPNDHLLLSTERTLEKIQYSRHLKDLLLLMLMPDEADRPDFLILEDIVTSEFALQTLNTCSSPADLTSSLLSLNNKKLTVRITLETPCSNCTNTKLRLDTANADYVFCECGKHAYCNEQCYAEKERGLMTHNVSRSKAPCSRLSGSRPVSKTSLKCMQCAFQLGINEGQVHLYCNPEEHIFCSISCIHRFIAERCGGRFSTGDQITCPRCEKLISVDLLSDIYGSKEQYYQAIKKVCMMCANKKFKLLTWCGHTYCKKCCLELKGQLKLQRTKKIACGFCSGSITESEITKALSLKKRLKNFLDYLTT